MSTFKPPVCPEHLRPKTPPPGLGKLTPADQMAMSKKDRLDFAKELMLKAMPSDGLPVITPELAVKLANRLFWAFFSAVPAGSGEGREGL